MQPIQISIVPVTPFQQNCSILWCTKTNKGVVIDPGGDLERVKAAIAETGVDVEKILLTHGHLDHAGGAAALSKALGVPVHGPHEADQFIIDAIPEAAAKYGIEGMQAVKPDLYLNEGDALSVGELTFDILHVPGHSPGHLVFVNKENNVAIVGDTLFKGSIGRTDMPYGSQEQLVSGIVEKMLPLGDRVVCVPGHGPITSIGDERATNPFLPR